MFDEAWFAELQGITQSKYDLVPIQAPKAKTLGQISSDSDYPMVSLNFTNQVDALLSALKSKGYPFGTSRSVRLLPKHLYTFPQGRAFKIQINLGWFARHPSQPHGMRIGVGVKFSRSQGGRNDWESVKRQAKSSPALFDEVFAELGSYGESLDHECFGQMPLLNGRVAEAIQNDRVCDQGGDHWRFLGRYLSLQTDREILTSTKNLADEADRIFSEIRRTGIISPPYN